jgi:hypothetical protein
MGKSLRVKSQPSAASSHASKALCRPFRDSSHEPYLPGTNVPGYRLFRPYGTVFVAAIKGYVCRKSEHVTQGRRGADKSRGCEKEAALSG